MIADTCFVQSTISRLGNFTVAISRLGNFTVAISRQPIFTVAISRHPKSTVELSSTIEADGVRTDDLGKTLTQALGP